MLKRMVLIFLMILIPTVSANNILVYQDLCDIDPNKPGCGGGLGDTLYADIQDDIATQWNNDAFLSAYAGSSDQMKEVGLHLMNNPGLIKEAKPTVVENAFDSELINKEHEMMTEEQVGYINPDVQTELNPETIQEILPNLKPEQVEILTEEQTVEFTPEDIDVVIEALQSDDASEEALQEFLEKLSQDQFVEYVTENANVEDLPEEFVEALGSMVNEVLKLTVTQGQIVPHEGGFALSNEGVTIPLSTFSEGSWEVSTTESGFNVLSGSDYNEISFTNPVNNETVETVLQAGQGIIMELLDESTFVLKLNDEFINLDIVPDGPSKVRFYSKVDDSTIKIYTNGDYEFSEGILSFDNALYHEEIDTMSSAVATIDHAVGFVCMQMNKEDLYMYEDRITLTNWGVKMTLDAYKFCVKKTDYIKDLYFDSVLKLEEVQGNRKISYVNMVSNSMWFGSWIEYYVNNVMSYQSRGRFGTGFNNGEATVTTPTPEKTFVTGPFVIWEEVDTRFLRVSTWLSDFSVNYITNNDDPDLFISSDKIVQVSPSNVVTVYAGESSEGAAFEAGLVD